ncbi:winged helix-turn-helix domain-containing protein [Paraburkholderia sp. D15]|uniref:winged helix-turn-helix domain-containing protein n=1 Tax=Paraburkholderia sp. D15 TaxID=2880218 RepID=UPI00247983CC|nr:winged helix-turn-helix domain-containing protein [Paraburkholderia sp. D15]WGS51826.1 winged helix-turn-helix domain-containing protein [Paraburkholderia sp. D15]
MRILIVGRTHHMGEYLTRALSEAGFVVDWMRDGPDSHIQAGSEDYDLVILDLALSCAEAWLGPGHDDRGEGTPLLLLGSLQENNADGRQDAVDANRGTRFEFPKLLKQIRNLLHCGDDASILKLADLQLNLKRRSATRQGRSILLTSKEFSLLWLLMRHQGEILPRAIIASQVWDMNFSSGTNVVDVLVRRLRLKIDNGQFPKLIHTVRNMGYVCEDRSGKLGMPPDPNGRPIAV